MNFRKVVTSLSFFHQKIFRKFQVSSIILTSFRWEVILPNPSPPQTEPLKTPLRLSINQKLFPTDIVHDSNTVYLCISPLTWWSTIRINILSIYYKLGQGFIRNWSSFVSLQIGASVIINWGSLGITKWGRRYYKLGQQLQIRATVITNWSSYYKLRQNFITN